MLFGNSNFSQELRKGNNNIVAPYSVAVELLTHINEGRG